jgi:MFS family permease
MSLATQLPRGDPGIDSIAASPATLTTLIPARLERLPWGRFHVLVVAALGVTWILDGLEVTLAGSIGAALKSSPALRFTDPDVGAAGSAYLLGAVLGALLFGWLTDRLGRKRLFFITIAVYLTATALTGLAWSPFTFFFFRFLTGCGIGGEYAAINSTIQELIPARYRGHMDLMINGSFWIGAAVGAVAAAILLDPAHLGPELGWRLAFLIGAGLGLVVFFMRMWIPESPRWLVIHGRVDEAEASVADIERRFTATGAQLPPVDQTMAIRLRPRSHTPLAEVFDALFRRYVLRTWVGLTLMAAQAFFYNAIFFTYALVLTKFYGVSASAVGWYILPFALGNFLGPVLLGRLFDTLGRRKMIAATYAISGVLLVACGALFEQGLLTAVSQTVAWMIVFFFASPAASAAYLTVSETFPLEIRALAIAIFYAIGTGLGGVAAPIVFGWLVASGSRPSVFAGYLFAAALMAVAAWVAARYAVEAERKPLEMVATPLSAIPAAGD